MNSKQLSIVLGVIVVVLLAVVGYMALKDNSQTDTLSQQNTTPNSNLAQNTSPPVNNTTPTNTAETANWKIYTNTTYGYSIKYPASWEIISEDKNWSTEFSPIGENYYIEGEPEIGVIRVVASPDVKFDKSKYPNAQQITLDGRTAYKTTGGYGGEVSIHFDINGIPLGLVNDVSPAVVSSENKDKANEYNRIFDLMVSTFKFAN